MRIGLLHYSSPPIVGGVEQTLYYHARILSDLGHEVHLVVGAGEPFDPRVQVSTLPTISSKHPSVLAIKWALNRGQVTSDFEALREELKRDLAQSLARVEALIVHNALTLHKNMALTAALWDLWQDRPWRRFIGWHHDFAWLRPQYQPEMHEGYPWDLLRRPWPDVLNVTVSQEQREQLAGLYGVPADTIRSVPPGFDPASIGIWTESTTRMVEDLGLLSADLLLLLPARITRRKNIELAIEILAELRGGQGDDARLLISGPPGPHNPANLDYLKELLAQAARLGVQEATYFLFDPYGDEAEGLDQATLANLYSLADALLFPSRQEGFGIPVLEAAWSRLPVFCSDIPPFRESGGPFIHTFSLDESPKEIASRISSVLKHDPAFLFRRRARMRYTWPMIVSQHLIPLLSRGEHGQ